MHDLALDQFTRSKESLLATAHQLAELARQRDDKAAGERARHLADKLASATFNLAVVGEFKRGKSTLVNALIRESLLPTAVIPLTSVTTIISSGPKTVVNVIFINGAREEIAAENLKDYVSESENPNNCKQVSVVEIEHPSQFLKDGVRIIDTPGVGSANTHNTKTTYDYLPQIDAAIFMFSADQPASQAELNFLKEVSAQTPKLFLVQNKIDYLANAELDQSLAYLSKTVETALGVAVTIYPISARAALTLRSGDAKTQRNLRQISLHFDESNSAHTPEEEYGDCFAALKDEIMHFLAQGKAQTLVEATAGRLTREVDGTRQLLRLEQHSRRLPLDQLRNTISEFEAATTKILQEETDAEFIVRGETAQLLNTIEQHLHQFVEDNKQKLVGKIDACYLTHQSQGKSDLIKSLHQELMQQMQSIFDQWRLLEETEVASSFEKITARFTIQGNLIIEQIRQLTKTHFGIETCSHFELEPLTCESRHRYAVDDPFTLAVESLPLLLPAPLARPIIRARFLKAAANELSRNAGRLRADFQERINKTTKDFLHKFKAQIAFSLQEISAALTRATEKERQSAEAVDHWDSILAEQLETLNTLDLQLKNAGNVKQ